MNENFRIKNWINQVLTEISHLNNNKGYDILHNCGKCCCELSNLYSGAIKIKNQNLIKMILTLCLMSLKLNIIILKDLLKKEI